MSIEDTIVGTDQPESKDNGGFFSSVGNFLKDSYNNNASFKPVRFIERVIGGAIDIAQGGEDRANALGRLDIATGGYGSAIKSIFSDDKLELQDSEKNHLNDIKTFQATKTKNAFRSTFGDAWTDAALDVIPFYTSNSTKLKDDLSKLNLSIPDDLYKRYDDIQVRYEKGLSKKIESDIKREIESGKLPADAGTVKLRQEELYAQYKEDIPDDIKLEFNTLQKEIDTYVGGEENKIYSQYINPEKGLTAKETADKGYSENSAVRTQQYIVENIVNPIIDSFSTELALNTTVNSSQDQTLNNMVDKYKEKLVRDYQYKFELLSNLDDDEEISKINAMITPQIEARKKYFRDIITNYQNSINEYTGDIDTLNKKSLIVENTKDKLIRDAYDNAFNNLTETERKALLVRDGTDTIVDTYINSKQTKDGIVDGLKDKDFKKLIFGAWNAAETLAGGITGITGAMLSGVSSATIKEDDKDKVFLDEYELSTANDNVMQKLIKHTFYNVDDIAEIAIPTAMIEKYNKGTQIVQKGINGLKKLSEGVNATGTLSKKFEYTAKGILMAVRLPGYGLRGVTSGVAANTIADRQMRTAETDALAYANMLGDIFIEPIMHLGGKGIGGLTGSNQTAAAQLASEGVSLNPVNQNLLSFLSGEADPSQIAKDLLVELKKDNNEYTIKDAYNTIRQGRDFVLGMSNKQVDDIFTKSDAMMLYKTVADNLPKLQNAKEIGANKMYTEQGAIIKIEDIQTHKNEKANDIVNLFNMSTSKDVVQSTIGKSAIGKYYDNIVPILKGEVAIEGHNLNIKKEELTPLINKFEAQIASIKGLKENQLDIRKEATIKLYNDLFDVRNAHAPERYKTKPMITIYAPLQGKQVKLALDDLVKVRETAFDDLLFNKTITITDTESKSLGVGKGKYYISEKGTDYKGSLLSKLQNDNPGLRNMLIGALSKGKSKNGYIAPMDISSDIINFEQDFIEIETNIIKKLVESLGGDTNVEVIDIGEGLKLGRNQIANAMVKTNKKFSIAYGKPNIDTGKVFIYFGLGGELNDKLGLNLKQESYTDKQRIKYHEKSSEIILDILSQKTIKDGIEFAIPLNNVEKFDSLTSEYKSAFLTELLSNNNFYKNIDGNNVLSKEGQEIKKFVLESFKDVESTSLGKVIYEYSATRIVNNYGVLKPILDDIKNLNKQIELGIDVEGKIIKTKEDLVALIKAFSGERTKARVGEKLIDQFDFKGFKKEAGDKYDSLIKKKKARINMLEKDIQSFKDKISVGEETNLIKYSLERLSEELTRTKNSLTISRADYIKRYSKQIYQESFDRLFDRQIIGVNKIIQSIIPKVLPTIEAQKEVIEAITTKHNKINEIKESSTYDKSNESQTNNISELEKEIRELEDKKTKLNSLLEDEEEIIKELTKPLRAGLANDLSLINAETTAREILDIANEHKEILGSNEAVLNYFIERVNSKVLPENVISKDSMIFISKKELKKGTVSLIEGNINLDLDNKESALLKMFGTALTGAANTESARGNILLNHILGKFTGDKEVKTLSELYFSGHKNNDGQTFEDLIKSFNATGKDIDVSGDENKSFNIFKKYIDHTLSELVNSEKDLLNLIGTKGDTKLTGTSVLSELKKNTKFYTTLFKRFKKLTNMVNNGYVLGEDLILKDKQIIDKVILTENISKAFEEKGFGYRILNISKISYLNSIVIGDSTLGKIMSDNLKTEQQKDFTYNTDIDTLKELFSIANWQSEYDDATVAYVRDILGLGRGEYLVGTYGDKYNSVKVFKSVDEKDSFEEAYKKYEVLFAEAGGFKLNENKISNDDIAKRETAMVSTKKEFEDVTENLTTYILEKIPYKNKDEVTQNLYNKLYKDIEDTKESEISISDIVERIKLIDEDFDLDINGYSKNQLLKYLEGVYDTDMQDGLSFMSNRLANLHDIISSGTKYIGKKFKDKAKKFHFVHTTEKGETFLGKTLFNRAKIELYDLNSKTFKESNNVVLIGENSVKLKGGYDRFTKSKYEVVKVNGVKYNIVGELKGANTGAFRDAASDSYKIKEEQTISEQIVNIMNVTNKDAFVDIQKNKLKALWSETIGGLGTDNIELPTFGEANIWLQNLQNKYGVGSLSDSIIGARVKAFIDGAKEIISGSKSPGASYESLETMVDLPKGERLKRNEIILSKKSSLVVSTLKLLEDRKSKLIANGDTISKEYLFIEDQLTNGIYTTGFRNPIPNKENLGLFRVRYAEDVGLKDYVLSHSIITHPETATKFQLDHDGDHILLIPLTSDEGMLIGRDILGFTDDKSFINSLIDNQGKAINFKNSVAVIDQVKAEKNLDKDGNEIPDTRTLMEHEFKNAEAKATVGIGSSTIRTINIIRQIMDKYRSSNASKKEELLSGILFTKSEYIKSKLTNINVTLGDFLNNIISIEKNPSLTIDKLFEFDNTYGGIVGSVLQLILDFAKDKTGKDFNKQKWIKDIINSSGLKNKETIKYIFNEVLSKMGPGHKSKTENFSVSELYGYLPDEKIKFNPEVVYSTLGFRRDLWKFIYSQQYIPVLNDLNKKTEIEFVLDNILSDADTLIKEFNIDGATNKIINFDNSKILKDEDGYFDTETNSFYTRISQYGREDSTVLKPELQAQGKIVGGKVHQDFYDYFNGVELKNKELQKELDIFKAGLEERGERIEGTNILVKDESKLLMGEIDLLTVDVNGKYNIYDLKTIRASSSEEFETKMPYKDKSFANDLNILRVMLNNNYGILADKVTKLPIRVAYDEVSINTNNIGIESLVDQEIKAIEGFDLFNKEIISTEYSDVLRSILSTTSSKKFKGSLSRDQKLNLEKIVNYIKEAGGKGSDILLELDQVIKNNITATQTDYYKVFREMDVINSKGELNYKYTKFDRDLLILASLSKGNKTLFNLLSDADRIDLLEFGIDRRIAGVTYGINNKRINSLLDINPDAIPTLFISDKDGLLKLKQTRKEIELEIQQIETDLDLLKKKISNFNIDNDSINSKLDDSYFNELDETLEDIVVESKPLEYQELEKELSIKEQALEKINELDETLEDIGDNLSNSTRAEIIIKEGKVDFDKTLDVDFESTYLNDLDITYRFSDVELKELSLKVSSAADFHVLLNKGMKQQLEALLSSYNEDILSKQYTALEVGGRQGYATKRILEAIEDKFDKDMKELGLTKDTTQGLIDKIKQTYKFGLKGTNSLGYETFEFNGDLFNEVIDKYSVGSIFQNIANGNQKITDTFKLFADEMKIKTFYPLTELLERVNKNYEDVGGYSVNYPKSGSFFKDLLGFFNGDLEFEFRRRGIFNKAIDKEKAFVDFLRKSAEDQGTKFNEKKSRILYNRLFNRADEGMWLTAIKNLQALHYAGGFQAFSLLLGGAGHISGMTQILGNTLELLGWSEAIGKDESLANLILKDFNLIGEDLLLRGQGKEKIDLEDTYVSKFQAYSSKGIKKSVELIMNKLGLKDEYTKGVIANIMDTTITEPMFATDLLQDLLRKQVSAVLTMREMGFKTYKDLLENMTNSREKDRFKSLFYRRHAELGGGVISTIPILRETFITNYTKDAFLGTKVFKTLYKYLMGWSIHKVISSTDKFVGFGQAMKYLSQGKPKQAEPLLREFFDAMTAMGSNIVLATGIAMKLSKYNTSDEDDKTSTIDFINDSTNILVAFEIMFSREAENLFSDNGESPVLRGQVAMYDFLTHITRILKVNPYKMYTTMQERKETLGESNFEAFYGAMQNSFSSYIRGTYGMDVGKIYNQSSNVDALGLYYGYQSKMEGEFRNVSETNKIGKMDSIGFGAMVADLFSNYVNPAYFKDDVVRKYTDELLNDKQIQLLYNGSLKEYDLDQLMVSGSELDTKAVTDLYNNLVIYQSVGQQLGDGLYKEKTGGGELYNTKYDDIITNHLKAMGITKEDLLSGPITRNAVMQKLYYEVSQGVIPELSTKHLSSYIISNNEYEIEKDMKANKGKGSKLEPEEIAIAKRIAILEAQRSGLLDLNLENRMIVVGEHTNKFHPELVKKLERAKSGGQLNSYMDTLMISNYNLKEGDTSAKYLTSIYSKGLSGMLEYYHGDVKVEPTAYAKELMVGTTLKLLKTIDESNQPMKEKIAKKASLLVSLNNTSWNLLRDNEEFNKLTMPEQRQITSWLYKTNKELSEFDAKSISNYSNSSTFTSSKRGGYSSNFFKKGQSSGFASGARPGFASQFPQMGEFLRGKEIPVSYDRIALGSATAPIKMRFLDIPEVQSILNYSYNKIVLSITTEQKRSGKIGTNQAQSAVRSGYVKTKKKRTVSAYPKLRVAKQEAKFRRGTIGELPSAISNIS